MASTPVSQVVLVFVFPMTGRDFALCWTSVVVARTHVIMCNKKYECRKIATSGFMRVHVKIFKIFQIQLMNLPFIKAVDLEICPYTMVGTRFYLVLEKLEPSANHCLLGQVSSTQLVQNVSLSKIGSWASI